MGVLGSRSSRCCTFRESCADPFIRSVCVDVGVARNGSPPSSLGTRLDFFDARPTGAGFIANSVASGVGGGKNEDPGDGKGEEDAKASRWTDSGLRSYTAKQSVHPSVESDTKKEEND